MVSEEIDTIQKPVVFILGAPRSGTSAVGRAVTEALGSREYSEGHMMDLFADTWDQFCTRFEENPARRFDSMLAAKLGIPWLFPHYADYIRSVYRSAYDEGPIVDKTPGFAAVQAIPFTKRIFPQAKFIFCKRRALENVESRIRKWPDVPFDSHCKQWVAVSHQWNECRESLRHDEYLEIEQLSLAKQPESIAESLCAFLELNDRIALYERLREDVSLIGGSKVGRVLSLDELPWPDPQKRKIQEICGAEMIRQGYTWDTDYWSHR
jgi:hypothetical protein